MTEIIGQYEVSRTAFDGLSWQGMDNGRKFRPTKEKVAYIDSPHDALRAAAGVELPESEELAKILESLDHFNAKLKSLVGRAAVIKSQGWRDGTQAKARLFSPSPPGTSENFIDFRINNRNKAESGFYGWDTYLAIHGLADVYDIWYECADIGRTTIQSHLLRTTRQLRRQDLNTQLVHPVEAIEIIDDPAEIEAIAREQYPNSADELLEDLNSYIKPAQVS